MHSRLIAVGDRQPSWVDAAFGDYVARLPRQWQFRLEEIATAKRPKSVPIDVAKQTEGEKILARIKAAEHVVVMDERGKQFSSKALAEKLDEWQTVGEDLVFVIGGPDGVSADVLARANTCWSLSKLTLPHGLARVLFVEQIYRAWSLTTGHPYHRE
ncbi:MAG: 23S rRNA (pseudouridine(1915)-N(3))-methyltransferase RlmH [Proteobacteria bacterium]|nr:23S rRNA (pseudouridine(1915)-N(3))-methyltransferase RlmH [Pseudomonadota bacterium]MDA0992473.1 23S rRNA (pseudouridine(1915)-N(3))-methyltransferase RlmH [Pseudomonadota bacterium]